MSGAVSLCVFRFVRTVSHLSGRPFLFLRYLGSLSESDGFGFLLCGFVCVLCATISLSLVRVFSCSVTLLQEKCFQMFLRTPRLVHTLLQRPPRLTQRLSQSSRMWRQLQWSSTFQLQLLCVSMRRQLQRSKTLLQFLWQRQRVSHWSGMRHPHRLQLFQRNRNPVVLQLWHLHLMWLNPYLSQLRLNALVGSETCTTSSAVTRGFAPNVVSGCAEHLFRRVAHVSSWFSAAFQRTCRRARVPLHTLRTQLDVQVLARAGRGNLRSCHWRGTTCSLQRRCRVERGTAQEIFSGIVSCLWRGILAKNLVWNGNRDNLLLNTYSQRSRAKQCGT